MLTDGSGERGAEAVVVVDGRVELARADLGRQRRHVVEVLAARVASRVRQPATQRQPYWSSYIGSRLSKELHTSCVCSCVTSTLDKHHSTCQTVYPQFLHSAADTS